MSRSRHFSNRSALRCGRCEHNRLSFLFSFSHFRSFSTMAPSYRVPRYGGGNVSGMHTRIALPAGAPLRRRVHWQSTDNRTDRYGSAWRRRASHTRRRGPLRSACASRRPMRSPVMPSFELAWCGEAIAVFCTHRGNCRKGRETSSVTRSVGQSALWCHAYAAHFGDAAAPMHSRERC